MKNFFKPEDFEPHSICDSHGMALAKLSNEKLNKLIESWPVVYGYGQTPGASSLWNMNGPEKERHPHTHKALLAFIEEITNEPCKHEPTITLGNANYPSMYIAKCKHCNTDLVADWKEKI